MYAILVRRVVVVVVKNSDDQGGHATLNEHADIIRRIQKVPDEAHSGSADFFFSDKRWKLLYLCRYLNVLFKHTSK